MGEGFDKKLGRTVLRPERSHDQHDYLDEEINDDSAIFFGDYSNEPFISSEDKHMVDQKAPYILEFDD